MTQARGGPSDGCPVIAAAGGDKTCFGDVHGEQRVHRAARFEAARMLHLFEFEADGHAKDIGFEDRGTQHMRFNPRPSVGYILCCYHCVSPLLGGMNACLCRDVLAAFTGAFCGRFQLSTGRKNIFAARLAYGAGIAGLVDDF